MQPSTSIRSRFALVTLFLFATDLVLGQTQVATLTGTVTDSSGAVLSGATINVTNRDTGIVQHTVTNESGVYSATALIPGPYVVTVAMPGFKSQRIQVTVETAKSGGLT